MIIGVPTEIKEQEYRVGLVPAGVGTLTTDGHQVLVQQGAGLGSGISDQDFIGAGVTVVPTAPEIYGRAELVMKVKEPLPQEYDLLRPGQIIFTYLHLAPMPELTEVLLNRRVTAVGFETVQADDGSLPLLTPMSEVAGRMAVQVGACFLARPLGGKGVLLGGTAGTDPGHVTIVGSGTVGANAAATAVGLGARVTVLGRTVSRLEALRTQLDHRIDIDIASPAAIDTALKQTDLVVGAVLVPGARAPKLITRSMLTRMQPGGVIVDVAIDQGGCTETSRPTTHSKPTYVVDGIVYYCVANMPGAVPKTATLALNRVTLPLARQIAAQGLLSAAADNHPLLRGINTYQGRLLNREVARAQGKPWEQPELIFATRQRKP